MRISSLLALSFLALPLGLEAQRNGNCQLSQIVSGNAGVHNSHWDTVRVNTGRSGLVSSSSTRMGSVALVRNAQDRVTHLQITDPTLGQSASCPVMLDAQGRPEVYIRPVVSRAMRRDTAGNTTNTQQFAYSPVRFIYGVDGNVQYQIFYEDISASQIAAPNPQQWSVQRVKAFMWQNGNIASSATYKYTSMVAEGDVRAPEIQGVKAKRTVGDGPGRPLREEHLIQTEIVNYSNYTQFANPMRDAMAGHPESMVMSKNLCTREETNIGVGEPRVTETTITPDPADPNRVGQIKVERVGMIGGGTTNTWFSWQCR